MNVKDYGDVCYDAIDLKENVKNMFAYPDVISCNRELSENVKKIINDGRVCLTIGGDHSVGN